MPINPPPPGVPPVEPTQPAPPIPPTPPPTGGDPCQDPCSQSIRSAIFSNGDRLDNLADILGLINDGIGFGGGGSAEVTVDFSEVLDKLAEIKALLEPNINFFLRSVNAGCEEEIYQATGTGLLGISNQLDAIALMLSHEKIKSCNVEQAQNKSKAEGLTDKIYKILGGDTWFTQNPTQPAIRLNPESETEANRSAIYRTDAGAAITVNSLYEYLQALGAVQYHRAGFHRFPARVPENLAGESNQQTTLQDAMSWQEWLIKQIDGLQGAYPIKIKVRDAENQEKTLNIKNQAEMLAEMMGVLLSLNADTDILQDMSMKSIIEVIGARMAATQAYDYSKANSEFLGYKYTEEAQDIDIPVNPKAKNLKEFMEESKQKVRRFRWVDQDNLVDIVRELLKGVGIIKGAFWRTLDIFGNDLPGDRIKDSRREEKNDNDQQWRDFVTQIENPPAGRNPAAAPKPDLDNLGNYTPNNTTDPT